MNTAELARTLNATRVCAPDTDREVAGAYTSDLLSDAMANAPENGVLVTIQAHKNTVAVATLRDLAAIVICNNRPIPDDMIEAARSEGIAILQTAEDQFAVSGRLYPLLRAGS